MAKPITWNIIETTEAIVRALDAKGLTVNSSIEIIRQTSSLVRAEEAKKI